MFLLLPLFLIQVFWLDRPNGKTIPGKVSIGLFAGLSAVFCMITPITLTDGYFLDFRQIPIILCFLYGGYRSGVIATVIMLIYRAYLGGTGANVTLIATVLLGAVVLLVALLFSRLSVPARVTAAVGVSVWGVGAIAGVTFFIRPNIFHNDDYQVFLLQYAGIQALAMWVTAYLIELIIRNIDMRETVEQSKKMKLVSELAASVSHEVRNPLTVTRGFIQLLRQDNLPAEKRAAFFDLALGELDRAESIINDFLNFAKPQIRQVETLDLQQEARFISDIISPYAMMNKVDVRLLIEDECRIRGEKDKFRQCLVNLAKNAVEAMPEGGSLQISVSSRNGKAVIRLADTGVGMTPEQISRLGIPYYSTKDKGTGLGTMVVYSIIQAMGGKIDVQSKLGGGTCFTLTFPCEDAPMHLHTVPLPKA